MELLTIRLKKHADEEDAAIQEKLETKRTGSRKPEKSTFEEILASPITKQIGKELVRGMFSMLLGSQGRRR